MFEASENFVCVSLFIDYYFLITEHNINMRLFASLSLIEQH